MPTVKYVANAHPQDKTEMIRLNSGDLILGGPPMDITDEEFAKISGIYQIAQVRDLRAPEADPEPDPDPAASDTPKADTPVVKPVVALTPPGVATAPTSLNPAAPAAPAPAVPTPSSNPPVTGN